MKYQPRVIIYIDLLGFKDFIGFTSKTNFKRDEKLDSVYNFFNFLNGLVKCNESEQFKTEDKVVTSFSDLIVISFPANDFESYYHEFLEIQIIIANCISNGFLIRGSIVYGNLIHTPSIIFGPGLIEAYENERIKSKYPRVIIDKTIIEDWKDSNVSRFPIELIYSIDKDGEYFIDYFAKIENQLDNPKQYLIFIKRLAKLLKTMRSNPLLKEKFEWLHSKFYKMLVKAKIIEDDSFDIFTFDDIDFENADYSIYDWLELHLNEYDENWFDRKK